MLEYDRINISEGIDINKREETSRECSLCKFYYLFVNGNGRQELKFKYKTDQLVKKKLCIGNLSDEWTTSESGKTGLYGNIYDFVADYEQIGGVKAIYDMHRYLMTKHNISP